MVAVGPAERALLVPEEFGFEDLTREYVGHAPAAVAAALQRQAAQGLTTMLPNEDGTVVIATGSMDEDNRRRAAAAAPLAWLPKPYTGDELVATVNMALHALQPTAALDS